MNEPTAALARSITWASSKQTYYTARLLVDRDLTDGFFRAYAYFRWADDVIDLSSPSGEERISFVLRQRTVIDRLYRNERPVDLTPQEEMIADLIDRDRGESSGLQSFIRNMFAVIEFDAGRRGRLISQRELAWYTSCLARSVTDGLQHFIGHGYSYPLTDDRYLAATGAHIAHLLRDMVPDVADGFINIPREVLKAHGVGPDEVNSAPFRAWVRERVTQARQCLREGKRYLDGLDVLRCRIAGRWYCARFEGVLDTIERDGHILRAAYNERHKLSSYLSMAWLGASLTLKHIGSQELRDTHSPRGLEL